MGSLTRKTLAATVRKADGRTRTFKITTGSVDRDRDTIDPSGWDFSQWLKNPVVLWAHDSDQWPIARGSNLRRQGNGWLADFEFADTPEGTTALGLIDAGMLNACSVGFRPLEQSYDSVRGGTNFLQQELLEVSIVPVPANAEALVQRAASLGLSASVVRKMFGPARSDDDVVLMLRDDDEVVLMLADPLPDPSARFHHLDVRDAIKDVLPSVLRDLVRDVPSLVRAELGRRRGRVD